MVGEGHSSPIVAGDKVFLTSSVAASGERLLLAYDRAAGGELWRRVAATAPPEEMHPKNTPASSTPATDGELVVAAFAVDSRFVVYAYTAAGEPAWRRDLGPFVSRHGFHSCPVIVDGSTLVAGLQDSEASFVARLDTRTGETLWNTPAGGSVRSFSPPHVVAVDGRRQVVVSGADRTVAFDWATGGVRWTVKGPSEKTVSSIVELDGRLFVSGGRDSALLAIDPQPSEGKIAWRATQGVPYVPSPVAHGDAIHLVSDQGVYTELAAATGQRLARRRLLGATSSSPVLVGSRMLVLDESGRGAVIDLQRGGAVVAEPTLAEGVFASPAVTRHEVFVRTTEAIYCFRNDAEGRTVAQNE